MDEFLKNRKKVAKALSPKSLLILGSLEETLRQPDVPYPYRQDSNFYYLTGFLEAKSVFVLLSGKVSRSFLFINDKDTLKEAWDGYRETSAEVKKRLSIDQVFYLSEIDEKLKNLLKGKTKILSNKANLSLNKKIKKHSSVKIQSAEEFLAPFREIKSEAEVSHIKKAISATKHAHEQIALHLKPQINERTLHGIFLKSIMEKGSVREGYGSIIACGNNATTLHYVKNNSVCKPGELLLVDAGAEMNHYTADVTRVYPVNGKFSRNQKTLYEKLLKVQKKLIKEVKPKTSMKSLNEKMKKELTSLLIDMKILKGSLKNHLEKNSVQKYCPHSLGHLLGLDVHDPWFKKKGSLVLKKGMVITIEPGIYISKTDKSVPKDLRGVGLRIEDNILITQTGQTNLTKNIPKEVKEIETLCSKKIKLS